MIYKNINCGFILKEEDWADAFLTGREVTFKAIFRKSERVLWFSILNMRFKYFNGIHEKMSLSAFSLKHLVMLSINVSNLRI